jgi:hypothetical protein
VGNCILHDSSLNLGTKVFFHVLLCLLLLLLLLLLLQGRG